MSTTDAMASETAGGVPDGEAEPEDAEVTGPADQPSADRRNRPQRRSWKRAVAFGVLPTTALLITAGAGYLKYCESSIREADAARVQSVTAAIDGTIALLSYGPDDVELKLTAAQSRLTGAFRDAYASLTKQVVIPGAKQQRIAATASVPAAASLSASNSHAEVMVFVNQAIVIGTDAPTNTASAVEVTLDRIGDRWLISGFDPK